MTDYRVHVIGADDYFIKAVYPDFADAEAAIESTKFKWRDGRPQPFAEDRGDGPKSKAAGR